MVLRAPTPVSLIAILKALCPVPPSWNINWNQRAVPFPRVFSSLIISAAEPDTSAKPRMSVAIIASLIPKDSQVKSGSDYLAAIVPQLRRAHWKMLGTERRENFGGREFWRLDYFQANVYESNVCIILKGYVINFIFTGRTGKDLDSLIESLHTINFESARTGH